MQALWLIHPSIFTNSGFKAQGSSSGTSPMLPIKTEISSWFPSNLPSAGCRGLGLVQLSAGLGAPYNSECPKEHHLYPLLLATAQSLVPIKKAVFTHRSGAQLGHCFSKRFLKADRHLSLSPSFPPFFSSLGVREQGLSVQAMATHTHGASASRVLIP